MGASPDKAKKRAPFRFSRPDGSRGDYQELAALEVILKDLKQAIEAGAKPVYGIKMLLYQGAESFKIWTGRDAPIDVMENALRDTLKL